MHEHPIVLDVLQVRTAKIRLHKTFLQVPAAVPHRLSICTRRIPVPETVLIWMTSQFSLCRTNMAQFSPVDCNEHCGRHGWIQPSSASDLSSECPLMPKCPAFTGYEPKRASTTAKAKSTPCDHRESKTRGTTACTKSSILKAVLARFS